jgi:hypothetical protein
VFGLAVDGVTSVTVTLSDGRVASGSPVANFFVVELPVDAAPQDVANVQAKLVGNSVFSQSTQQGKNGR